MTLVLSFLDCFQRSLCARTLILLHRSSGLLIEVKDRRGTDYVNFPDLNMQLFTCSQLIGTFHQLGVHVQSGRVLEHVVFDRDVNYLVWNMSGFVQGITFHVIKF